MICLSCGYETDDKSNYNKHLLTEKHAWYSENNTEQKVNNLIEDNGYLKCEFCKYMTKRSDNLKRHLKLNIQMNENNTIDLGNNDFEENNKIKGKIKIKEKYY